MKCLLISSCIVLFVAGICANPWLEKKRSDKERLRDEVMRGLRLIDNVEWYGLTQSCSRPLSAEETAFGNEKIRELIKCRNATVDIFMDKFDDSVILDDIDNPSKAVELFAKPVCEILDDICGCIGGFRPVFDMCLREDDKILLYKVFDVVPLIQQTSCLRNGALMVEIAEIDENLTCINRVIDSMTYIGYVEVFKSNSTELFGDVGVCQRFNGLLQEMYGKVGECSVAVLEKIKEMLGVFCERTQCERFIDDLHCY